MTTKFTICKKCKTSYLELYKKYSELLTTHLECLENLEDSKIGYMTLQKFIQDQHKTLGILYNDTP